MTNNQEGKVYLVGAGPGDVAYLTVKAHHLLTQAQILIYDALVDEKILELVPHDCVKLDVGKRGGKPSTSQTEINRLLVKYCHGGKQVIRLKSGDPFIFGRSTSEIDALKVAGCKFEVVPGISSALAAPTLAGIPLTDSVLSRCFAVVTGHEPDALDWEALSRLDTLVILMGGQHLSEIIHQVLRRGRSRLTPIAILRAGGTQEEQIWIGTLGTIIEQMLGISLSPAVIVIGEVVGLRKYLEFEKIYSGLSFSHMTQTMRSNYLPLAGKTILVTRASGQSTQLHQNLTAAGANVIEMPALEIGPPSNWQALDEAINHLSDFHWLVLASTNAVDYFFERLIHQGKDIRSLLTTKIAVVGEKTAASLKQRCLQPNFVPPDFIADSLVDNFPEELTNKKILFPRVETGGKETLVSELTAKGAEVVEVPAYQSYCPSNIPASAELALESGKVDVITFASSKTVQFFCQLVEKIFHEDSAITNCLQGVCIASIGPQTSKTCHSLIGRVDVEAKEYTLDGLTQALITWAEDS